MNQVNSRSRSAMRWQHYKYRHRIIIIIIIIIIMFIIIIKRNKCMYLQYGDIHEHRSALYGQNQVEWQLVGK